MNKEPIDLDEEQRPINFLPNKITPETGINDNENIGLEKQKTKKASFKDIFYFATKKDKIIMIFAAIFSLG